jgi:acyl-CoA synthetase (AMP-forming)/AMP-acid ligase II
LAGGALAAGEPCGSFQTVYTGGGPVFPRVLDKLAGVFPNADIVTVYGSSEAEPIAKIAHRDITTNDRHDMKEGRGLLVGFPIHDIDLRIYSFSGEQPVPHYTSEQFEKDCVPLEHPGEIVVRGDHVIPGYLGGRGDREHKLEVDGERWHRTGDSGFLDREGRLWLLGRCSERIIDGQGEVFPFSVEVAALHREEIHRAALLNVRGKRWLVLEPKEKNAPFPLKAVEEDLDWADIEMFQILSRIPVDKRHNVKIDYPSLKKILQT